MTGRPGTVAALACALVMLAGCGTTHAPKALDHVGTSASPGPTAATSPAPLRSAAQTTTSAPSQPAPSITIPTELQHLDQVRTPVLGADVSWPQCPRGMGIPQKRSFGAPMPSTEARFVVVGLTNGPGFTPNPCLADQVTWVRSRHLLAAAYAVLSYPDARTLAVTGARGPYDVATRLGRLGNVGYQQALYNVDNLRASGLHTPIVWLDVEPVPLFDWSSDVVANAAVVRGAARGYRDQGLAIGAYSTQVLWQRVVGDLALGVPEWRAAGETSHAEAVRRCGNSRMFQGGKSVLAQWVEAGRDRNVTCGGTSAELAVWFHQY